MVFRALFVLALFCFGGIAFSQSIPSMPECPKALASDSEIFNEQNMKVSKVGQKILNYYISESFGVNYDFMDWGVPTPKCFSQLIWYLRYKKNSSQILYLSADIIKWGVEKPAYIRDAIDILLDRVVELEQQTYDFEERITALENP